MLLLKHVGQAERAFNLYYLSVRRVVPILVRTRPARSRVNTRKKHHYLHQDLLNSARRQKRKQKQRPPHIYIFIYRVHTWAIMPHTFMRSCQLTSSSASGYSSVPVDSVIDAHELSSYHTELTSIGLCTACVCSSIKGAEKSGRHNDQQGFVY